MAGRAQVSLCSHVPSPHNFIYFFSFPLHLSPFPISIYISLFTSQFSCLILPDSLTSFFHGFQGIRPLFPFLISLLRQVINQSTSIADLFSSDCDFQFTFFRRRFLADGGRTTQWRSSPGPTRGSDLP